MTVRISEAYRLLREVAIHTSVPCLDIGVIELEIREADDELRGDESRFDEHVGYLNDAISEGGVSVDYALIRVGIFAKNISTVLSNLADEIEKVVIARRDSADKGSSSGEQSNRA